MAAILNSAILYSAMLHKTLDSRLPCYLTQTQIHSHLTWLMALHSEFWLNLVFSHLHKNKLAQAFSLKLMTATILNSAIIRFRHLVSFSEIHLKTLSPLWLWLKLIQSDLTSWWLPSWILPCWIQTLPSWILTPCYLLSDSLINTLTPFWLWLKLIQADSNSCIVT